MLVPRGLIKPPLSRMHVLLTPSIATRRDLQRSSSPHRHKPHVKCGENRRIGGAGGGTPVDTGRLGGRRSNKQGVSRDNPRGYKPYREPEVRTRVEARAELREVVWGAR